MNIPKVKIGFAPTRRAAFSAEHAAQQRRIILNAIKDFDFELVDIDDVTEEGLIITQYDVVNVTKKFRDAEVDALFIPHCNFGSEGPTCQVCENLKVPVLLWGPRDDAPASDGMRFRDSQCGMFAASKVLRRHNVPFTYLTNSAPDSDIFLKGFEKFLRVAAVVKAARNIRVLQIGPRPQEFLSVMVNESELIEKFNMQTFPIAVGELVLKINEIMDTQSVEYLELCDYIRTNYTIRHDDVEGSIKKFAALKLAIRHFAQLYRCNCAAIQCWPSLPLFVPLMQPCFVNSLLSEEGFPVACETDICGAISALLIQAATGNTLPHFLADVTIRHPEDDNVELLWHCGPFPKAFAKDPEKHMIHTSWMGGNKCGSCWFEMKNGPITVCRFDGDHGNYSLLISEGEGVDGPMNKGSYVWYKVKDWPKLERRLVEGPYIHHVAGTYGQFGDVLLEACKYIPGLTPDPVDPTSDELKARFFS